MPELDHVTEGDVVVLTHRPDADVSPAVHGTVVEREVSDTQTRRGRERTGVSAADDDEIRDTSVPGRETRGVVIEGATGRYRVRFGGGVVEERSGRPDRPVGYFGWVDPWEVLD